MLFGRQLKRPSRQSVLPFLAGAGTTAVLLLGASALADDAADDVGADLRAVGPQPAASPSPSPTPSATAYDNAVPAPEETGAYEPPSTPEPYPSGDSDPSPGDQVAGAGDPSCPDPTVTVATADELTDALATAQAGDSIALAPGTYNGAFVATGAGTQDAPIALCGPADAVLEGNGPDDDYVLHLDGVSHWRVAGFTVRDGQKGVMADGAVSTVISGLTVEDIGDEAIHLRGFSTDNLVEGNTVRRTGLRKPKYGEGIYIGTAKSNWCDITDCEPDRSDRNVVRGNTISETTAEAVDIKEGTTGGKLVDNTFDGSAIDEAGADSWVDVKGNDWVVQGNTGVNSPEDGFQTHEILGGWGQGNVFRDNVARVNGPGHGFSLTPVNDNRVSCDNKASGAKQGLANVACR
nr:right-handed parallel beta-helix repeat-containing protein [Motilibacter deserti]